MKLIDLDVVLVLPDTLRRQAILCSELLCTQAVEAGSSSNFRLGAPFPGESGAPCEPHVSLFMLAVNEMEIDDVTYTVEQLAKRLPTLAAEGAEYRHNPYGAPELYFTRSTEWRELQRAVIDSIEPFRHGLLRKTDPSGTSIRDVMDSAPPDDPKRQQLLRYGYDEVADESAGGHDLFNPHVTLTWPRDPTTRIPLDSLPPPHAFSGSLSDMAVFGMKGYGTCTDNYGTFPLLGLTCR